MKKGLNTRLSTRLIATVIPQLLHFSKLGHNIARIFPCAYRTRKNTTQLAK